MRVFRRVLLGAVLAAVLVGGFSRLSLDVDFLKLLPQDLPQVQGLSLLSKHFSLPQEIIFTVDAQEADRARELRDSLAAELGSREDLIALVVAEAPWDKHPEEMGELVAITALNQSPERFAEFQAKLTGAALEETVQEAYETVSFSMSMQNAATTGYDPFGILGLAFGEDRDALQEPSAFASPDESFRLIYATAAEGFASYKEAWSWLESIQELVSEWQARQDTPESFSIGMTGEPVFLAEISESMERDMMRSGLMTLVLVSFIFWLFHRRFLPMVMLVGTIVAAFMLSLSLAGLVLGQLTVLSVGFASILIGLSVDYGLLIYQRRLVAGEEAAALRRSVAPGILWAAATTASAFLALNAGSYPGLAQFGTLVALGILVAAALMLGPYSALIAKLGAEGNPPGLRAWPARTHRMLTRVVVGLLLLVLVPLIFRGFPKLDISTTALHPKDSIAYDTSALISDKLTGENDTLNVLVRGDNETEVVGLLQTATAWLDGLAAQGIIESHSLPVGMWPNGEHQTANLQNAMAIAADRERLKAALLDGGFSEESFALTESVLSEWAGLEESAPPVVATGETPAWMLRRITSHTPDEHVLQGIVTPAEDLTPDQRQLLLQPPDAGIFIAAFHELGPALSGKSIRDFVRIGLAFSVLLVVMLIVAYRRFLEVGLTVALVALSFLCLTGAMVGLGMIWNYFSLAAVLLILGTGVDYSIHMLFALRNEEGNLPKVLQSTGNPIALCGLSTLVGFASLGLASNQGLASLGVVCAMGIGINLLLALFVLPRAWQILVSRRKPLMNTDGGRV